MPHFKATAFVQWEFDVDGDQAKAVEKAVTLFEEIVDSPLDTEKYKGFNIHVDVQPMKDRPQPVRLREYELKKIVPFITEEETFRAFKVNKKSYNVRMNSQRYHVFRQGTNCVSCGLDGNRLFLETNNIDDDQAYFNLYCEDNGKLVVMTKDHIKPKAYGGLDVLDNLQPMCYTCNQLKASYPLDLEGVRALREIAKKHSHLSKKQLNDKIQKARLLNMTALNGQ
jgi:5-methylcytosine-specific restriction endonuclease McrA